MIKAGITGTIGSGKTTVCKIFETLGVPVYYADNRAKEIIHTNEYIISEIKTLFGNSIYNAQGLLDKKKVAELVFSNADLLKKYNALIHPAVIADSEKWTHSHRNFPYTLKEAALLFESGSYTLLDKIICVTAPLHLKIKRVIERDNTTEAEVLNRLSNQWSEEKKIALSDFIIENSGEKMLIHQVLAIHTVLLQLSDT